MKHRNYYRLLGVSKDATAAEIQHAYRICARKYHPDVNKDKDAEARFKEINEANDVLKDPVKRKLYDRYGEQWAEAEQRGYDGNEYVQRPDDEQSFYAGASGNGIGEEQVRDLFGHLFSGNFSCRTDDPSCSFGTGMQSYQAEIYLGLSELIEAGVTSFSCKIPQFNPASGQVEMQEKRVKVRIPRGSIDGSVIRVKDFNKTINSIGEDLLLTVRILPDPRFRVVDHDLFTVVSVAPWEAAIGAKIGVDTVNGSVNLSIPAGTRSGRKFRLKGKGLPGRDGRTGDMIVEIHIQIPASLSVEEKRLFKELSRKSQYNPRTADGQKAGVAAAV